jgi:hypothetical protein
MQQIELASSVNDLADFIRVVKQRDNVGPIPLPLTTDSPISATSLGGKRG